MADQATNSTDRGTTLEEVRRASEVDEQALYIQAGREEDDGDAEKEADYQKDLDTCEILDGGVENEQVNNLRVRISETERKLEHIRTIIGRLKSLPRDQALALLYQLRRQAEIQRSSSGSALEVSSGEGSFTALSNLAENALRESAAESESRATAGNIHVAAAELITEEIDAEICAQTDNGGNTTSSQQ